MIRKLPELSRNRESGLIEALGELVVDIITGDWS